MLSFASLISSGGERGVSFSFSLSFLILICHLQVYLIGMGSVLLALNAATIWRRWRRAGDLTRVVAELLGAMGVPLRRQVIIKAIVSAAAAFILLVDLTWTLMQSQQERSH